jgi:DNA integrity scanning protein DisA with diadenylate cyclase activity
MMSMRYSEAKDSRNGRNRVVVGNEERLKPPRSDRDMARMIAEVARSVRSDAVICGTESGVLFRHVHEIGDDLRLVAATPNAGTYDALSRDGFEVVRLSARVAHKYTQVRYAIAIALNAGKVSAGQLVVCAIGHDLCSGGGDLVVVTDIESSAGDLRLSELVKLTDGIRPDTLQATLTVASKIGRVTRGGKPLGALLVLGDSRNVLERSRQLILNPFEGHEEANRTVRNPDIHEMLVELAKLDGAFVLRGDGFIQTAGAFLAAPTTAVSVPRGLGARHLTAAAVTANTNATAVVVSSTDGDIRVFSRGELVLQLDPELPVLATPEKMKP